MRGWLEMREWFDVGEADGNEIWYVQRARARDVADGVAADVTVLRGVRQFADAHAIENDPNDAIELGICGGHGVSSGDQCVVCCVEIMTREGGGVQWSFDSSSRCTIGNTARKRD